VAASTLAAIPGFLSWIIFLDLPNPESCHHRSSVTFCFPASNHETAGVSNAYGGGSHDDGTCFRLWV
jgi:hypothetical protein